MDYLESLIDRALDAVVGMDAAGRVTAWNQAAEQIFGWSRDDALGALMVDRIVPPQHRQAHSQGLDHYNRTGEGPVLEQHIRITALRRDGTEFPVELSIFAVDGPAGEKMFYAFVRSLAAEEAFLREQELRAREAEAIMKIGQRLIEDVSLEEFAQFCLDEVCEIAGLDAGHMFVRRGQGTAQVLVPSGIWYLRNERFRPVIEATAGVHFTLGQGLPGQAWASGELQALHDLTDEAGFVRRALFAEVGLTRGVALPVRHGGQIHAVLEFYGTAASRLDPEILRMLKTVGSQIGAAIRRKEGAESRETLRREMMHRVGNSLTILASIYRSCSRKATTKQELDEAFLGRLVAIGRANRMAIVESDSGVPLPDLVGESLTVLPDSESIVVEVPPLQVASESVMPLSLVFHELAINALKHGDLGVGSRLHIRSEVCDATGDWVLEWHELHHRPLTSPPAAPGRSGFGTQLMRSMIEGRLGGTHERRLDAAGYHVTLRVPRRHIEAPIY